MDERAPTRECDDLTGTIKACQGGDRTAFHSLFEAYKDQVFSMALHFSADESAAKDVTQQVFLKLFRTITQFRHDAEFSTWLYRIVSNACVDEQRRRKRFVQISPEIEVAEIGAESQEDMIHKKQVADSVRAAIAALSPKLRLPMLLKYVEDLSYEEIAAALGCSKGTVGSRLNRGHKILARTLGHLRGEGARES